MKSKKTRKVYFFTLFHFVIKHFPLQSTDFAQIRKNWCFFKKFNLTPQKKQFSQKKTPFWGIFFFPKKSFIMCENFSGEVRSAVSTFRMSFCTHISNEDILAIWRKKNRKGPTQKKIFFSYFLFRHFSTILFLVLVAMEQKSSWHTETPLFINFSNVMFVPV